MSGPRDATTLASVIRGARQRAGLSGRMLARKAKLSAQALCDVEYNRRGLSPEAAVRVAKALDLPVKEVLWLAIDYRITRFKIFLHRYGADHVV